MSNKTDVDVYLGVQIELNQRTVALMPKTPVNKIAEKGIEFELAKPVNLGKVGDALTSLSTDLGIPDSAQAYFKTDETKRKTIGFAPIDEAIDTFLKATLQVEALSYKKFPEKDKKESQYLFAASAEFETKGKEGDFFKVKGIYVIFAKGMSEEKVATTLDNSMRRFAPAEPTKALAAGASVTLDQPTIEAEVTEVKTVVKK